MLIGHAKISTKDQNLDLQGDALTRVGCIGRLTDIFKPTLYTYAVARVHR